jgi:hypothetical protein
MKLSLQWRGIVFVSSLGAILSRRDGMHEDNDHFSILYSTARVAFNVVIAAFYEYVF